VKYFSLLFIPFFFLACGGGGSSSQSSAVIQPPLTQGDWYRPTTHTTWQWQLSGVQNTSYPVELYDLDLFDTTQNTIDSLHQQGAKVICYFSAGSYEDWREDKDDFDHALLGNNLDGWAGEKWLDISSELIRPIMIARLDLAKEKGCDGVEPDNVDGYTNNSGFALSESDQLSYNTFLSTEAHKRSLSIGLKNDLDQISILEPYFDFAVNEQCHQYNECDMLTPFITNNKPVFNAEYKKAYVNNTDNKRDLMCSDTLQLQFKTLVLPLNLDDSFRISCN
jgi:hypothetical protein